MSDLGKSKHGIPDVVMVQIDKYVDGLAPNIQTRISSEMEEMQTRTIDSLEDLVVDAFRSLFKRDGSSDSNSRSLNDAPPDAYGFGSGSLPFANEIVAFTQSISKVADGASDDIRDIFDLTEGNGQASRGGDEDRQRGSDSSRGLSNFLSSAIDAVKEHRGSGGGGGQQPLILDGLLGVLSSTVKDATRDPEGKARVISPEIKEKLGAMMRSQHAPISEQFTQIALTHIKRWLRGNTSTRDLGDGVKGEITELVSGIAGMFGKKSSGDQSRSVDRAAEDGGSGGSGGFSGVISDKLSVGIAKVHREVRLEFRNVLGVIEKNLFEALPDQVQGPLEKLFGGNPFDNALDSPGTQSRGLGDDLKAKLVNKIRDLVRKVQESLRQSVLSVVNGGHRKFERASWLFIQENVEQKVQRFLPDVKIRVPDDIGNEGVNVGTPQNMPGPGVPPPQAGQPQGQGQYGNNPPYANNPSHSGNPPYHREQPHSGGAPYGGGNPQYPANPPYGSSQQYGTYQDQNATNPQYSGSGQQQYSGQPPPGQNTYYNS